MTKPGPNGVLYRITVSFRDPGKPAFDGEEHWSTWAYSLEHANDLFREQHEGFKIVRTQLETETAENPRRAPSKRYGDIEWRWENEGNYRAFVGGQPTEWLGTRNDNEPPSSSLRWALLRGDEIEPYTELGSLEAISGALGRMLARGAITRENPNPRPKSHGFIVVDTRTGEILSDLFKRREGARDAVAAIVAEHGRTSPAAGDVEYKGGRWYRALGVHQVMLYPGQTYDRGTYKP